MTDANNIPWKRLIAEGVAIVVSILLAFWIDAWWDERNEEITFRENLLALKQEIAQNLSDFDRVLSLSDGVLKKIDEVFGLLANPDLRVLPDSFTRDIGAAYPHWGHDTTDSALNVVMSPTNLMRIESMELRLHLTRTSATLADVVKYNRSLEEEYAERQAPILARYFILSETLWYANEIELKQNGLLHSVPKSPYTLDHEEMRSAEFWNLLYIWRAFYLDYAKHILLAKRDHLITLELLEMEMERHR